MAQQSNDDKRYLYNVSERYSRDKQEFIPLDGNEVKMIPYRVDKLFGFVDKKTKKEIIKPKFKKVWSVSEHGAIVEDEKEYIFFITNDGKQNGWSLPYGGQRIEHYGSLTKFNCSDSNLYKNDGSAICLYYGNKKFDDLFDEKAHAYKSFLGTDTLAWFRYGEDIRIRNLRGDILRTMKYDKENTFMGICSNMLVFKTMSDAKDTMFYSAYDLDMNLVIRVPVHSTSLRGPYRLSEKLFAFNNQDGELYFADFEGILNYGIIAENVGFDYYDEGFNYQQYYSLQDFDSRRYGVADSNARIIIQFDYDYIGPYSNGFMFYRDSSGTGFMNLAERKIPVYASYDYLMLMNQLGINWQFSENLLLLPPYNFKTPSIYDNQYSNLNNKPEPFRFLDTNGKVVITLDTVYRVVGNFNEGLAPVVTNDLKIGFINTKGELVIPTKYEFGEIEEDEIRLAIPRFINGYAYLPSNKGYIDRNGYEYFTDSKIKK